MGDSTSSEEEEQPFRLLDLPTELIDLVVQLCAYVEKDSDVDPQKASSYDWPKRNLWLYQRMHTLGRLRLVCRRLREHADPPFWTKISSVVTPKIKNVLLKTQPPIIEELLLKVRELEIEGGKFGVRKKSSRHLRLWACHNLRVLHLLDVKGKNVLTTLPKCWNELVPNLEEVVFNASSPNNEDGSMARIVDVNDLLPFWCAPKLKILEIGNTAIEEVHPTRRKEMTNWTHLPPLNFLSFRNCGMDPRAPSDMLTIRNAKAAEVRDVNRDLFAVPMRGEPGKPRTRSDPLLDALAPFVTQLTFHAQNGPQWDLRYMRRDGYFSDDETLNDIHDALGCYSRPLPDLSAFAVLSALTIDLGNLCYLYWKDVADKWDDLDDALSMAWTREGQQLAPLPLESLETLPESLRELTIEIRTFLVDFQDAGLKLVSWLERSGLDKSGSSLPRRLELFRLDALKGCATVRSCRLNPDLRSIVGWQWGENIIRKPEPRSEEWKPRDRIVLFDSAQGGYLFAERSPIPEAKHGIDYWSDDDDMSHHTNASASTIPDDESLEFEEICEDSDSESSSLSGEMPPPEAPAAIVRHPSEVVFPWDIERMLITASENAGIRFQLVNGTLPMTDGRVFGSPHLCPCGVE